MSLSQDIAGIRKDYILRSFSEEEADTDPFVQFTKWWQEAANSKIEEYNAMTLSTCNNNKPSSRIVLLKGFDENGFTFFTNYSSKKGKEIADNPNVSLVFFWKELERQIRIEGVAKKVEKEISNNYFISRPEKSQIAAWASDQSNSIPDRSFLEEKYAEYEQKFSNQTIQLPPNWGGYKVWPQLFEFWQGRRSRLHDRLEYIKDEKSKWVIRRLAP